MKSLYKRTSVLGLVFFTISISWSVYNTFVPIFLERFFESTEIIGFIMTLEGFAGLFLYPTFGVLSDRTRSRLGRRLPYLLFGMTAAAMLLTVIPNYWSLLSLTIFLVSFNIVMVALKGPGLALMADLIPDHLRSVSNGIISFFAGIGALGVYLCSYYFFRINETYPFLIASFIMFISLIILYKNIKEEDHINFSNDIQHSSSPDEELVYDEEYVRDIINILLLLGSVFFLFFGFKGMESFFLLFAKNHLGLGEIEAARIFTFFSLSMVIFAIPSGILAYFIGRKRTGVGGLLLMTLVFVGLKYFANINMIILFIVAGASFALVNINSYPLLLSMTNRQNIGRFTGYYYMCICVAAIVSPLILGKFIELFGYSVFYVYTGAAFMISFMLMLAVKSPEERLNKDSNLIEDL